MEQANLEFDDIRIVKSEDSFVLIFLTDEMYLSGLLNDLGYEIKVDFIEDINNNVLLNVIFDNGKRFIPYNTNKKVVDYPPLEFLRSYNSAFWSVGYSRKDGTGFFHMPTRILFS